MMNNGTLTTGDQISKNYDEINNYLLTSDSNFIIKEDYNYWNGNKRDKNKGKMLILSDDYTQYFFDDNDCVYCIDQGKIVKSSKFIHINSLKAQLDENYYINFLI